MAGLFSNGRPIRRGHSQPFQTNTNVVAQAHTAHPLSGTNEDVEYVTEISPSDWGPLFWKLFHITAERVGRSGVDSLDRDMAIALEFIVDNLPAVLPCAECQAHSRSYIRSHPFGQVKTKRGSDLRAFVRQYFFDFHNFVRISTGKQIIVSTVEDCRQLYENEGWQKCEMEQMVEYFSFGVHHGIIKADMYKRWMTQMHKLRLIASF